MVTQVSDQRKQQQLRDDSRNQTLTKAVLDYRVRRESLCCESSEFNIIMLVHYCKSQSVTHWYIKQYKRGRMRTPVDLKATDSWCSCMDSHMSRRVRGRSGEAGDRTMHTIPDVVRLYRG